MAIPLFLRETQLIFAGKEFNGDDFTIGFEVPFDDGDELNVATIKIYNLSEKTINEIKKDKPVIVNAGYKEDYGAILLGFCKYVATGWSGLDKITTIDVIDDKGAWLNTPVKVTYKAGTTARDILNDLLQRTGLEIGAFELPVNQTYPRGKTFNTKLSEAVKLIAKDCKAKVHINKSKIFIRAKTSGTNIGFVVNAESGLIGSPERVEKEIKETKTKKASTVSGWKVKTLLNHRITTDAILQIESKTANGIFRVESGKHAGESNGGSYYTEMEVYPV
ncbi:hypothetical protein NYE67_20435 [Solibacillus sp. FSL W8-0474]|uniref:phage protein n=1 Tax=Solibacillus sp. FSL W8-0474 TaxID=2975336 RepID=UPI0030FC4B59